MQIKRTQLLVLATLCAVLAGWFGMNQKPLVLPFLLAISGILFAAAAQQRKT